MSSIIIELKRRIDDLEQESIKTRELLKVLLDQQAMLQIPSSQPLFKPWEPDQRGKSFYSPSITDLVNPDDIVPELRRGRGRPRGSRNGQ